MTEGRYRFRNGFEVAFDDVVDLGTVKMTDMLDLPTEDLRIGFDIHLRGEEEPVRISYSLDELLGGGSSERALRFTEERCGHLGPSQVRALAGAQLVPDAFQIVVADWSKYVEGALQHHDMVGPALVSAQR